MTKPLDLDRAQRQFRRALGVMPSAHTRPAGRVFGAEALEKDGLDGPRAQEKAAQLISAIGLPATWVDPVSGAAPEESRYPFVWAALDVLPAEVRSMFGQGTISFTGECFAVDPGCADHFLMEPIVAGNIRSDLGSVGDGWLPCSAFKDWKRWDLAPMTPANCITFKVWNVSKERRDFRAVMFGRVHIDRMLAPKPT